MHALACVKSTVLLCRHNEHSQGDERVSILHCSALFATEALAGAFKALKTICTYLACICLLLAWPSLLFVAEHADGLCASTEVSAEVGVRFNVLLCLGFDTFCVKVALEVF